jgi:hypothetical protein
MDIKADDLVQIDDLERPILAEHAGGTASWRTSEHFGTFHEQRPPVIQTDLKPLKRPGGVQLVELLGGHGGIVSPDPLRFQRSTPTGEVNPESSSR